MFADKSYVLMYYAHVNRLYLIEWRSMLPLTILTEGDLIRHNDCLLCVDYSKGLKIYGLGVKGQIFLKSVFRS